MKNKSGKSDKFVNKLFKYGEVINRLKTNCDNGVSEMIHIRYTNGVEFLVFILNDEIITIG